MLIALLLAAGLALGGYCLLLAWRRAPLPPAAAVHAAELAPLPLPQPLAPGPEFARPPRAADAAGTRTVAPQPLAVTFRVHGVPAAWRTERAGLGVFPADGSSGVVWLPLADPAGADGVVGVDHTVPRAGEYVVGVAAERGMAVHGYLTRARTRIAASGSVEIDVTAARVALELPPNVASTQLLRLVRSDDPHWLLADATSGLTIAPKTRRWLWLGAGGYDLCDPLQPEHRQHFEVPADTGVTVAPMLVRARGDRQ